MDGARFYSADGPFEAMVTPVENGSVIFLRLLAVSCQEFTTPFTAASRDPSHLRFANMHVRPRVHNHQPIQTSSYASHFSFPSMEPTLPLIYVRITSDVGTRPSFLAP